jgi:hypothetical protein
VIGKDLKTVKSKFSELMTAVLSSRKFTKLSAGVRFVLPDGKEIVVKVASHTKGTREPGYRLSKYSFITRTETDHGVEGFGFGEGENELLTFQKSIAESVERVVYRSLKPFLGSTSSNGWAAHLSEEKAKVSAFSELLERDAALTHWLTETPFLELDKSQFPEWLQIWSEKNLRLSKDFNSIRVLVSSVGFIPVVQVMLMNRAGNAFVSQGAGTDLEPAIYRALAEVCRIASVAPHDRAHGNLDLENSTVGPWDHALAYENQKFPSWIFGKIISFQEAKHIFKGSSISRSDTAPTFTTYRCGGLVVVQCKSSKVQNLFFGRGDYAAKKGLINTERLKVAKSNFSLNSFPHCVP